MNPLKADIARAVQASILDSGKFQYVEVHDIEFQPSSKLTETYIRVKEQRNQPARMFTVRVSEVM
jgi:hypothetical protein